MNLGRAVFSQLVDLLPTYQFQLCVDRYQGNRYVKDFSCWDQFLSLAFARLHLFTQACALFITRARKGLQFYRRDWRPVQRSAGLRCDQTTLLAGVRTALRYPDPLRRIRYFDAEKDLRLTFLTDNFLLPGLTIAQLDRALARGSILSLAQTAPPHQGFLRHLRKRREDAGLGGPVGVWTAGPSRKTTCDG